MSLSEAAELLQRKKISPVELTETCLRAIQKLNPLLNAFITVTAESALAEAKRAEREIQHGEWRGPLHGIPIALKDNIDTAGIRTTAASELFKDRVPVEDAEVVRKLKRSGAVLIGKTNLHEFAFGGTSAISFFGPVHNPWALDRVPGGSSGGSAAAVASELCFAALGTDTAGSLRIPASYCGVVGFKPTYGLVSTRGTIPASWTFDHVGPLCRTVRDAALVFTAISGYDQADPNSSHSGTLDIVAQIGREVSKIRIGVIRHPFFAVIDSEINEAVETAVGVLQKFTAGAHEVALRPQVAQLMEAWTRVRGVEAYTYHLQWITKSPSLYQPATRERILDGANVPASAYAQSLRDVELWRRQIQSLFTSVDVLIAPTMPSPPVTIVEGANPMAVSIRNTVPFNVLGLPAISLPCGFSRAGTPIGLQLIGGPQADATVLQVAYAYERATQWHESRPALI